MAEEAKAAADAKAGEARETEAKATGAAAGHSPGVATAAEEPYRREDEPIEQIEDAYEDDFEDSTA